MDISKISLGCQRFDRVGSILFPLADTLPAYADGFYEAAATAKPELKNKDSFKALF